MGPRMHKFELRLKYFLLQILIGGLSICLPSMFVSGPMPLMFCDAEVSSYIGWFFCTGEECQMCESYSLHALIIAGVVVLHVRVLIPG